VQTRGSLANRLMAITAGIRVSKFTGHDLIIGWEPNFFAFCELSDLFDHDFEVIKDENYVLPNSVFITNQTEGSLQILSEEIVQGKDVTIIAHHLFYLSMDYEKFDRKTIISEFQTAFSELKPVSMVADTVRRYTPLARNALGLQIRRPVIIEETYDGEDRDNIARMVGVWGYPSDQAYIQLAKDLIARYHLPGKIFLATASIPTRDAILAGFQPGQVIFYPGRSYNVKSEETSVQAVQDALIDILCLSKTAIITKRHPSTFSFFASLIGNIPQAIIYDAGAVDIKPALKY
jgi:hypothetical protein